MTPKDIIPPIMILAWGLAGCSPDPIRTGSTPFPTVEVGDAPQTGSSPSYTPQGNAPSGFSNPSKLRVEATPRSFRQMEGLSGYDKVSELSIPSFNTAMKQKGQELYGKTCARCHGSDGRPHDPDGSLARYNMVSLANPLAYKYGADERGIYRSLAYGTAAPPHGVYRDVYSEQELWSLVAFVGTLDAR